MKYSEDCNDMRDEAQKVIDDDTGEVIADFFTQGRSGEMERHVALFISAPVLLLELKIARQLVEETRQLVFEGEQVGGIVQDETALVIISSYDDQLKRIDAIVVKAEGRS